MLGRRPGGGVQPPDEALLQIRPRAFRHLGLARANEAAVPGIDRGFPLGLERGSEEAPRQREYLVDKGLWDFGVADVEETGPLGRFQHRGG